MRSKLALAGLGPPPFGNPNLADLGCACFAHEVGHQYVGAERSDGGGAVGPIFTDGSIVHAGAEIAAALVAAVLLVDNGVEMRGAAGRAPPELAHGAA